MATPTWKYPTVAGATATLSFSRGGFLKDVRVPIANQITDETEAGEIMSASLGDDKYEQTFTVQVPKATQTPPEADITTLLAFVSTTIGWAARPFWFTNSDSVSYLVKLLNTDLKPSNVYVNYLEYVFTLREV